MSVETSPPTIAIGDVAAMMDRMWQEMVGFPMARMCRHYAAGIVIQEMEKLGIAPPDDIVRAVVFAHDDISLAWARPDDAAEAGPHSTRKQIR